MQALRPKQAKRELADIGLSYLIVIVAVLSIFLVSGAVDEVVSDARMDIGIETVEAFGPEYQYR